MTTEMRVASCRLLLVNDGKVVFTQNHSDTGPVIPILASLLLDPTITHAYIAGVRLYEPLAELNSLLQNNVQGWRMRIANRRRHAYSVGGQSRVVGRFFVDYFSIDEERTNGRRGSSKRVPRRRFDVMNLDLLYEKPADDPRVQFDMALSLLEMCEHRGVKLRGTKGAIGSAMLKNSPEWEKGRKSAPRFVNREARKYLPGNFYSVSRKVKEHNKAAGMVNHEFSIPHCYYVDQKSSHHTIASSIPIPHPGSIHARGRYKDMLRGNPVRWCSPDSPTGQDIINGEHHGLVLCRVTISSVAPTQIHLYPQWATKRGTRYVWIWTPEFRLFQKDHRLQLEFLSVAFTGTTLDGVIPEYARWALSELQDNPERARHKKGALLAAYGMLAFNSEGRSIYRYWGGENSRNKVEIPIAGMVGESKITIPNHVELSTVNVIARGLIESETRTRSIEYARELTEQGLHVPQIYADGLLVQTDQMPFVPDNWRVSHSLTNVHIPRSNAIVSDQLVKLPGVAGNEQDREWERNREQARAIFAETMEPVGV